MVGTDPMLSESRETKIPRSAGFEFLTKNYLSAYGDRCGRDNIAFASSSFLNCSFLGSQYTFRSSFITI